MTGVAGDDMAKDAYGRHWGAGSVIALIIGFGFIGLVLLGFTLYAEIPGWARAHVGDAPRLGDLANAGQFFSLVFGIPLAFITLCVGLASVWHFSSTRDEVEILRFYEEKIVTPLGKRLQVITAQVLTLISSANACRGASDKIWKRYMATRNDAKILPPDFANWFRNDASDEDRAALTNAIDGVNTAFDLWCSYYLEMLTETYETALAYEQINHLLAVKNGTALAYLRTHLPNNHQRFLGIAYQDLSLACKPAGRICGPSLPGRNSADDPHDLVRHIRALTKRADEIDIIYGDLFQPPDGQTSIEYLGAFLGQPSFTLNQPIARPEMNGARITKYTVNLGAAVFLTLFQYLPTRQSLCRSFVEIYGARSGLTRRFLLQSGPDPSLFMSATVYQSVVAQMGHWERLLLVHTDKGRSECYDAKRHGPIPEDGYSNFPPRN